MSAPSSFARVPTGVPGLDALLGGGLLRGGLYLVEGPPGAGKTVLGAQLAFAHVAAGGRAAYVTLLTETHARMLGHLRPLAFFAAAPLGDALVFLSGAGALEEAGLPGLLALLADAIRGRAATLLVLDGLGTAAAAAGRHADLRRFLLALQAHAEAVGCTAVLLARAGAGAPDLAHTLVDGVLALGDERAAAETVRVAEVRKFRGGAHLRGRHGYAIGGAGLAFHPRIEARYAAAAGPPAGAPGAVVGTGVAGLDALLGGGLPAGAAALALGAPGTGKTLLGLHFLAAGARAGEGGLYAGFHEPPAQLRAAADRLGLGEAADRGRLAFAWQLPAGAEPLDAFAERLLGAVTRGGARRLVLDGLDVVARQARRDDRLLPFWAALARELRGRGVTTLATQLLPEFFGPSAPAPPDGLAAQFDTLLFLRAVELRSRLYRLVTVPKARGGAEDRTNREFRIEDGGIVVADTFASAEAILTGVARPLPRGGGRGCRGACWSLTTRRTSPGCCAPCWRGRATGSRSPATGARRCGCWARGATTWC